METSYSPVGYDYLEIIDEEISMGRYGKIFFFDINDKVDADEGKIEKREDFPGRGSFIRMSTNSFIRIDRIITVFGRLGPAFDEYDAYANECLSCTGGYEL